MAEFQEKAQKIKNKVVSAMAYPVIVLIIAILIMVFLMAFIVPRFQAISSRTCSASPPPITEFVIAISNIIQKMFVPPYLWYTIAIIVAIVAVYKAITGSAAGRAALDTVKLHTAIRN